VGLLSSEVNIHFEVASAIHVGECMHFGIRNNQQLEHTIIERKYLHDVVFGMCVPYAVTRQ
jgi:hypothetical protein